MAEAIAVEGVTASGMNFRGTISALSDGVLTLEQSGHQNSLQIGIPLESIRRIRLSAEPIDNTAFMAQMEAALPLLPLWDQSVINRLCAVMELSTDSGDWQGIYHWSRRLLEILPSSPMRERLQLLQAWSLLEMGLRRQAEECLAELLADLDPLEASPRLCWLAGRLALESGRLEEARSWGKLPALMIPAASGPIVMELSLLMREIDARH
ncbi:MAG TPA: tetratricopeptide repeat protein [Oceanipulchritudo sp.]|nr:tetratricopeptide repeat protein [Oceanipulchritudo sp.]